MHLVSWILSFAEMTSRRLSRIVLAITWVFLGQSWLSGDASSRYPVYLSQIPNMNSYTLFANGGWDGDWYVGYNRAWIKKLPTAPEGRYIRAYIGARIGRAKLLPPVGRPPVFNPIPGELWIGLAPSASWSRKQKYKLCTMDDISLEPSSEYALEHVGESTWVWIEVPLNAINFKGDNFLALWSTTPAFVSASSGPILAGAWGGHETNAWLIKNLNGDLPRDASNVLNDKTKLTLLHPALAIKLIPEGPPRVLHTSMSAWRNATKEYPKPVMTLSVEGELVQRVWIERNDPIRRGDVIRGNWIPFGRSLYKPPYVFTLEQEKLQQGKHLLRNCMSNIWEDTNCSGPIEIDVSAPAN